MPVSILGLSEVPSAGDFFEAVPNEKAARALVEDRQDQARQARDSTQPRVMVSSTFALSRDAMSVFRLRSEA